jgi:CheY-like chemotaxis protein
VAAPAPVVEVKPADAPAPAVEVKAAAPAVEVKPAVKTNVALVIDDEPANRDFLVRLLQQAKLDVRGASTAAEALQMLDSMPQLALIVIDNKLPDMNGVDLLIKLRPRFPDARMVMATMLDERPLMAKAFENGCDVFLVKPHGFMELFRRLQAPDVPGEDKLQRLIIDQYGPRPYRG